MTVGKKVVKIGIIAEDHSDIDSLQILISKIINSKFSVMKFAGDGCGKIKRKCKVWATQFSLRGCNAMILVHDLDRNDLNALYKSITEVLNPCPVKNHLICIPKEELEAWFLSDPDAIKKALNLNKAPKIINLPEKISSPKEYIRDLVYKLSNGEKRYLNTAHNKKISSYISTAKIVRHCPSFVGLHDFIRSL